MNLDYLAVLPPWAIGAVLATHLAAGLVLGLVYFRGLRWNTRQLAGGARVASVIALMAGRFALLAAALTLASLEGALPLLAAALGVLLARHAAVRKARRLPRDAP